MESVMLSARTEVSPLQSRPGWRTINEPRYKDRIPAFVQETLVVCTLNFCQQLGWDTWQFYNCSVASFWKKWFPETLCPDKKPAYLGGETYIWTCLVPHRPIYILIFSKMCGLPVLEGSFGSHSSWIASELSCCTTIRLIRTYKSVMCALSMVDLWGTSWPKCVIGDFFL